MVDGDGIHYTTGRTRDEEEEEDGGRTEGGRSGGNESIGWVGVDRSCARKKEVEMK